jgi:GNAT superfamily N-acetyltransferase
MTGKLGRIRRTFRFGLVVHRLQFRVLAKLGISIVPYYWTQEGVDNSPPPALQNGFEDYSFGSFGPEDIKTIASLLPRRSEDDLLARLARGQLCFGLKYRGQIAAFTWCELDECSFRWHNVPLNDHEAYLFDMNTMESFRGKGLAPYLRYRVYGALKEMGRDTFYSVTYRFNAPAIRFKQKLGAKFLWLGVGVGLLFGRVRLHRVLKRYDT